MAKVTVHVDGLEQLRRALRELPGELQKTTLAKAVKAGADVIMAEAQNRAPVMLGLDPRRRAGTLRDHIRATRGKRTGSEATAYVYVKTLTRAAIRKFKDSMRRQGKSAGAANNPDDPFYWRYVEFGTSKMRAQPFMRPAFDTQKEAALKAITTTLRDGIEKAAAKVAGKKLF